MRPLQERWGDEQSCQRGKTKTWELIEKVCNCPVFRTASRFSPCVSLLTLHPGSVSLFQLGAKTLAQQITSADHQRLCEIKDFELANVQWTVPFFAPTLEKITNHFNSLSHAILTEVCQMTFLSTHDLQILFRPDLPSRVQAVLETARTLRELLNLFNIQSVVLFNATLQQPSLRHLRKKCDGNWPAEYGSQKNPKKKHFCHFQSDPFLGLLKFKNK